MLGRLSLRYGNISAEKGAEDAALLLKRVHHRNAFECPTAGQNIAEVSFPTLDGDFIDASVEIGALGFFWCVDTVDS
jgi:hypothetical protein